MKTLIQINYPKPNGSCTSKTIDYCGNILFKKGFTKRFFAVGRNLGAWHIFGFRFTFYICNTSDINPYAAWYQKPVLTITLNP